MTEHVMMKCGCASNAFKVAGDDMVPSCVIHSCIEIDDSPLELSGRTAQCAYLPKGHAPRPSSIDLPFFEYHGPGSREAMNKCKCGYYWIAHQPRWLAKIQVVRRWFKHDRYEDLHSHEFNAPPELREEVAELKADFFRKQTREETKVFSATVESIEEISNRIKCKEFRAQGPQEFDKYYCGCHGWD